MTNNTTAALTDEQREAARKRVSAYLDAYSTLGEIDQTCIHAANLEILLVADLRALLTSPRAEVPADLTNEQILTIAKHHFRADHSTAPETLAAYCESVRAVITAYALDAAPAIPVADMSAAYVGAREDLAIWKRRALEAEELNRKFLTSVNGDTHMGEPVVVRAGVRDAGDDFHIECRMSDGQKGSFVKVDAEFPELAQRIAEYMSAQVNVRAAVSPATADERAHSACCPFCGSDDFYTDSALGEHQALCNSCEAAGPTEETDEEAIASFTRMRASQAATADERAAHLDLLQDVLDAKEVMLKAGCAQAAFAEMFAAYSARASQAAAPASIGPVSTWPGYKRGFNDGRKAAAPAEAISLLRKAHRTLACAALTQIRDGEAVWTEIGRFLDAAPADAREPVLYQSRVRQNDEKRPWTKWENCSKEAAEDYRKRSMTDDWNIEIRELFDYPVSVPADAGEAVEPSAWVTPEGDRAIANAQKSQMLQEGRASASLVRPYSIACYASNIPVNSVESPLTSAAHDVLAERARQMTVEGWTPEHDDQYVHQELERAAICYIVIGPNRMSPDDWPFHPKYWRPAEPRRELVKAAALLIAAIERLDRAEARAQGAQGGKGGEA